MVINVPLNSSVAANLIFASRFVLNINYHQCPLIFPLILASRKVFKIHDFLCMNLSDFVVVDRDILTPQ